MKPRLENFKTPAAWLIGGALIALAIGSRLLITAAEAPVTSLAVPVIADPASVFDPVEAGEQLPDGYRQLLDRDQIPPVYEPVFTAASAVDWPLDSLVLGVAGAETAKAYPITHLNQREMVIDVLEGTPILVSW